MRVTSHVESQWRTNLRTSSLERPEKMMVWHESSWLKLEFQRDARSSIMKPLVSDDLWDRLSPLLPPPPKRRFRFPGRKPLDYRKILTGILFVLKTGIGWEYLPSELGCGCGKTC